MAGRVKHPLGDLFGLKAFGVNRTILRPGAVSSLHHRHSLQDEFVYVLSGRPTLFVGSAAHHLAPGMIVGFPANGPAHHLENRTDGDCVILEVGDRASGDAVSYPDDDLVAAATEGGGWRFIHKDGSPYAWPEASHGRCEMSGIGEAISRRMGMDADKWARHANPWSVVWSRLATVPLFAAVIWSRAWIGWWCLVGVAAIARVSQSNGTAHAGSDEEHC